MDQRITTEQLVYKIGALTLELDVVSARASQLQQQLDEANARIKELEKKVPYQPSSTVSFGSISD